MSYRRGLHYTRAKHPVLDRRSSIYSNRPRFIMANEILTKNLAIGMMPYGDLFVSQLFRVDYLISIHVPPLAGGACGGLLTTDSTATSCLHIMIYKKRAQYYWPRSYCKILLNGMIISGGRQLIPCYAQFMDGRPSPRIPRYLSHASTILCTASCMRAYQEAIWSIYFLPCYSSPIGWRSGSAKVRIGTTKTRKCLSTSSMMSRQEL